MRSGEHDLCSLHHEGPDEGPDERPEGAWAIGTAYVPGEGPDGSGGT